MDYGIISRLGERSKKEMIGRNCHSCALVSRTSLFFASIRDRFSVISWVADCLLHLGCRYLLSCALRLVACRDLCHLLARYLESVFESIFQKGRSLECWKASGCMQCALID